MDDSKGVNNLKKNYNVGVAEENEVQSSTPFKKWFKYKHFIYSLKQVAGIIYLFIILYIMYLVLNVVFGVFKNVVG